MTTPQRIHLVRHGEVHNPDHLVYADLPGFGLSPLGHLQAAESATHLAGRDIGVVVSSPLQRAIETAGFIAARHGIGVIVDDRLTEWRLAQRWAGLRWDDLDDEFPGELVAYLTNPSDLPFSPESLATLGARVAATSTQHAVTTTRDVVVVSHQDPIHAGIRTLTGDGLADFNDDKPAHATVVSLAAHDTDRWMIVDRFDPAQGAVFPPPGD
jgi:broad specificity phosphatase PhoE